jgi:hypothetical protein
MTGVLVILAVAFLAEHIAVGAAVTMRKYSSASFTAYVVPLLLAVLFGGLAWWSAHP